MLTRTCLPNRLWAKPGTPGKRTFCFNYQQAEGLIIHSNINLLIFSSPGTKYGFFCFRSTIIISLVPPYLQSSYLQQTCLSDSSAQETLINSTTEAPHDTTDHRLTTGNSRCDMRYQDFGNALVAYHFKLKGLTQPSINISSKYSRIFHDPSHSVNNILTKFSTDSVFSLNLFSVSIGVEEVILKHFFSNWVDPIRRSYDKIIQYQANGSALLRRLFRSASKPSKEL